MSRTTSLQVELTLRVLCFPLLLVSALLVSSCIPPKLAGVPLPLDPSPFAPGQDVGGFEMLSAREDLGLMLMAVDVEVGEDDDLPYTLLWVAPYCYRGDTLEVPCDLSSEESATIQETGVAAFESGEWLSWRFPSSYRHISGFSLEHLSPLTDDVGVGDTAEGSYILFLNDYLSGTLAYIDLAGLTADQALVPTTLGQVSLRGKGSKFPSTIATVREGPTVYLYFTLFTMLRDNVPLYLATIRLGDDGLPLPGVEYQKLDIRTAGGSQGLDITPDGCGGWLLWHTYNRGFFDGGIEVYRLDDPSIGPTADPVDQWQTEQQALEEAVWDEHRQTLYVGSEGRVGWWRFDAERQWGRHLGDEDGIYAYELTPPACE